MTPTSSGSGTAISSGWWRSRGRSSPPAHRREFDEEDVALSAFHSFCERAGRGEFPQVIDRNDLWRLLSTITARKVTSSIRHRTRLKRGGGRVLGESALLEGDDLDDSGVSQFLSREPNPEDAAAFTEDYERLFNRLTNPVLKEVALRRLEGSTSEEIAIELGVSARTVDRKLQLIRACGKKRARDEFPHHRRRRVCPLPTCSRSTRHATGSRPPGVRVNGRSSRSTWPKPRGRLAPRCFASC